MERGRTYQGSSKIDTCCSGVGIVKPFRFGEAKELVASHDDPNTELEVRWSLAYKQKKYQNR